MMFKVFTNFGVPLKDTREAVKLTEGKNLKILTFVEKHMTGGISTVRISESMAIDAVRQHNPHALTDEECIETFMDIYDAEYLE